MSCIHACNVVHSIECIHSATTIVQPCHVCMSCQYDMHAQVVLYHATCARPIPNRSKTTITQQDQGAGRGESGIRLTPRHKINDDVVVGIPVRVQHKNHLPSKNRSKTLIAPKHQIQNGDRLPHPKIRSRRPRLDPRSQLPVRRRSPKTASFEMGLQHRCIFNRGGSFRCSTPADP